MKKTGWLLLLAALAVAATGLDLLRLRPYAREIEDMTLIRTLGVDAAEGGEVAVTAASCAQDQEGAPKTLTGRSGTISGALLSIQGTGTSYIFYGHVNQLLLGEELAGRDISPALEYVLRDVEMRLDTRLYVIKEGEAQTAISGLAERGESAGDRLEAMEDDAGLISHFMPRTVREVLNDLSNRGASFAPALETEEDGSLTAAGYALLKGDALAGWAVGEAARGINLYLGRVDADILETEGAALRIVDARTKTRPLFDGDRLAGLEIICRVEANLAEADPGLEVEDPAVLGRLEDALCQTAEARLRAALNLSQDLDADFLGLEQAAGISAPWRWADIRNQWDLSGLALEITVDGKVERSYDVNR